VLVFLIWPEICRDCKKSETRPERLQKSILFFTGFFSLLRQKNLLDRIFFSTYPLLFSGVILFLQFCLASLQNFEDLILWGMRCRGWCRVELTIWGTWLGRSSSTNKQFVPSQSALWAALSPQAKRPRLSKRSLWSSNKVEQDVALLYPDFIFAQQSSGLLQIHIASELLLSHPAIEI